MLSSFPCLAATNFAALAAVAALASCKKTEPEARPSSHDHFEDVGESEAAKSTAPACPDRPKSDSLRRFAVGTTPSMARLQGTLRGCTVDFEGSGLAEIQHPEPLPERLVLTRPGVMSASCEAPDRTIEIEVVEPRGVAIARTFGEERVQFSSTGIETLRISLADGESHLGLRVVAIDACGYVLDSGTGFDTLHARWKKDAACDALFESDPRGLAVDGFDRNWDRVSLKKLGTGTCLVSVSAPAGDASIRIVVE